MRKILLVLLVLVGLISEAQVYLPASAGSPVNKAISPSQSNSIDARSMFYDANLFLYRPYQSQAEVKSYLSLSKYRVGGFDILINVGGTLNGNGTFTGGTTETYYFKNGTADSDLTLKISTNVYDSTGTAAMINKRVLTVTIAQLRAMTNPSDTVIYYVRDNGKQGPWKYDASDVSSADNTGTILVSGSYRFKRIYFGGVYVDWFGAVPNNTTINTGIQDAINFSYSSTKQEVLFNSGTYLIDSTIIVRPGVSLSGLGHKFGSATQISMKAGANVPVLTNDTTQGFIYATGLDGTPQRGMASIIQNITFLNLNQTSLNADAIYIRNAWTFTFYECAFKSNAGFAMRLLDCNAAHIRDNFFSGSTFLESLADSYLSGNQMGPSDLPAVDSQRVTSIVWMSDVGCAKNILTGNFIYNAVVGQTKIFTVTPGSSVISCPNHNYTEGTPVIVESTGTTPSSFTSDLQTVYIHVIDANSVSVARSRLNLRLNIYLTPSDSGTGTLDFRIGGKANLYMNDLAQKNLISNNRFDQSYWSGLVLKNAPKNNIINNQSFENGRGNVAGQRGIDISVSSSDNEIVGNYVDGATVVTATGTSNQILGIVINSTAARNTLGPNEVINNSSSNVLDQSTTTLDETARVRDASLTSRGLVSTGTQHFLGDKSFTGNVIDTGTFTMVGTILSEDILPKTDITYNLGSSVFNFNTIRTNGVYSNTSLSLISSSTGDVNIGYNNIVGLKVFRTSGDVMVQNGSTFTAIPSSHFSVNSTTQGMLPPRMTAAQRIAISGPVAGLFVFDTDSSSHFGFTGSTWYNMRAATSSLDTTSLSNRINLKVNISDTSSMLNAYRNAGMLNTGTLLDARLSANVPLINATNSFSGSNTFTNSLFSLTGLSTGYVKSTSGALSSSTTIPASDITTAAFGAGDYSMTGKLGLNTTAPTHTLTLGSTSTGIAYYNTSDQTTNYERLFGLWNSNVFELGTYFGGSASTRSLRVGISGTAGSAISNYLEFANASNFFNFVRSTSAAVNFINTNFTLSGSSGQQSVATFGPTVSQSSTGGYQMLNVFPFENSTGSGSRYLIRAGTSTAANGGGTLTNRFTVESTGKTAIGAVAAATSAILEVNSTTQGFAPPRMTTTQKNAISSPAEGLIVYDLTLHKLCVFTGTVWETVTSL